MRRHTVYRLLHPVLGQPLEILLDRLAEMGRQFAADLLEHLLPLLGWQIAPAILFAQLLGIDLARALAAGPPGCPAADWTAAARRWLPACCCCCCCCFSSSSIIFSSLAMTCSSSSRTTLPARARSSRRRMSSISRAISSSESTLSGLMSASISLASVTYRRGSCDSFSSSRPTALRHGSLASSR